MAVAAVLCASMLQGMSPQRPPAPELGPAGVGGWLGPDNMMHGRLCAQGCVASHKGRQTAIEVGGPGGPDGGGPADWLSGSTPQPRFAPQSLLGPHEAPAAPAPSGWQEKVAALIVADIPSAPSPRQVVPAGQSLPRKVQLGVQTPATVRDTRGPSQWSPDGQCAESVHPFSQVPPALHRRPAPHMSGVPFCERVQAAPCGSDPAATHAVND
jgi:hypothetical protein